MNIGKSGEGEGSMVEIEKWPFSIYMLGSSSKPVLCSMCGNMAYKQCGGIQHVATHFKCVLCAETNFQK